VGRTPRSAPRAPTGEGKARTEGVLGWYDRCLDLRSVSLRYFNAAGAWPEGPMGEDWTVTTKPLPVPMQTAPGRPGVESLSVLGRLDG